MEMVKTTCYKDKNDRLHLSLFIIMLKSHHRKISNWAELQSSQIEGNNLCVLFQRMSFLNQCWTTLQMYFVICDYLYAINVHTNHMSKDTQ